MGAVGSGRAPEDLRGRTFGKWTVLERGEPTYPSTPGIGVPWLCRCGQGHEQWILPGLFKKYDVKCKACVQIAKDAEARTKARRKAVLARQEAQRIAISKGTGIIASRWKSFHRGAEARGIPFDITIEEAFELYEKQGRRCALSGRELTLARTNKDIGTASLDRIDSTRGYVLGNVQWVHKEINRLKNAYDQDHFIALCRDVASHCFLHKELSS